ncbi:MAG TPA: nuclear transport factor 2 family protein [Rhodothermales bacterium]|nr:nuclear transport factor 2 family protein [Rhodothermales bacterium]
MQRSTISDQFTDLYAAFNARDIDTVLAAMAPDVVWANGMEGGHVHGTAAVRQYWTRQWESIDPHVDPARVTEDDAGQIVVDVQQVVRDRAGVVIADAAR